MKKLACVLALSSAFVSFNAQAWGNEGHRAVGAIADKLLKGTNAEKQVAALLMAGESLESVSNWADSAKGGLGYTPPTPEMLDYTRVNPLHNEYHYANLPFQLDHYHDDAVGSNPNDIVKTLKRAIAVLQGKTGPEHNPLGFTKRQALMLIVHMTGDIHQPLHMGSAYVSADGKFVVPAKQAEVDALKIFESRGGNNLLLDEAKVETISKAHIPGEPRALGENEKKRITRPFHSYWDGTVVDYAMRRISTKTPEQFAQKAIESKPEVTKNTGDPVSWPYQWANDALVAAKVAYTDVTPGMPVKQTSSKGEVYYNFPLEMGANYPVPSSALAKTQLIKGGYNLAALLQSIWP